MKGILVGPIEEVPDGKLGSEAAGPSASRQKHAADANGIAQPARQTSASGGPAQTGHQKVRGEGIPEDLGHACSGLALSHSQRPVAVEAALHSRKFEFETGVIGELLELPKIGLPVIFPSASHHMSSTASASLAAGRQHGPTETGRPRELGMKPARTELESEMAESTEDLLELHNGGLPVVWPDGAKLPGRPRLRR